LIRRWQKNTSGISWTGSTVSFTSFKAWVHAFCNLRRLAVPRRIKCKRPLPLVDAEEGDAIQWACAVRGTVYLAAIDPRARHEQRQDVVRVPADDARESVEISQKPS